MQRNVSEEKKRENEFWNLQNDILDAFGTQTPDNPKLEVRVFSFSPPFLDPPSTSFAMLPKPRSPSNGHGSSSRPPSYAPSISTVTVSASRPFLPQ